MDEARRFCKKWCKQASGKKGSRRPYVKSEAFKTSKGKKRKIFIDQFWPHFKKKNISDLARRMRLLPCVRDLLENLHEPPFVKGDDYLFRGKTAGGKVFEVIIREKRRQLFLATFYPAKK